VIKHSYNQQRIFAHLIVYLCNYLTLRCQEEG